MIKNQGIIPQENISKTIKVVREDGRGTQIDLGFHVRQFKCKNGCEHHNHLVCVVCGTYLYIDDMKLEEYQDHLAREMDFKPSKQYFRIYGYCKNCQ